MRLQPSRVRARVTRGEDRRRPVLLTLGSWVYQLTPNEARTLADELVDATEQT